MRQQKNIHQSPISMKEYINYLPFHNLFSQEDEATCKLLEEKETSLSLVKIAKSIDFESYRPEIEKVVEKQTANTRTKNSSRGRPAVDPVLMLKITFLGALYRLSDEKLHENILDRATFRKFLNLGALCCPSPKTIWKYRELFTKEELFSKLFKSWTEQKLTDFIGDEGKIIDSSFVEAPKQRNTREENQTIKEGNGDKLWEDQPHKKAHKDIDARWTKKRNETHYGYKAHVCVDSKSKVITNLTTTSASVHDSQVVIELLDKRYKGQKLYLDAGYVGKEQEKKIIDYGMLPCVCEKGYRGHPLTSEQKESNRQKSKTRCRIEHVFGFIEKSMTGSFIRCIGLARASAYQWLTAWCYNTCRYIQLQQKLT